MNPWPWPYHVVALDFAVLFVVEMRLGGVQFRSNAKFHSDPSEYVIFAHFTDTVRGYAYALLLLPVHALANTIGAMSR